MNSNSDSILIRTLSLLGKGVVSGIREAGKRVLTKKFKRITRLQRIYIKQLDAQMVKE